MTTTPAGTVPGKRAITEVLPRQGLVYSEKSGLTEVLCKPKIMPIKSTSLIKLEEVRRNAATPVKTKDPADASHPPTQGARPSTATRTSERDPRADQFTSMF